MLHKRLGRLNKRFCPQKLVSNKLVQRLFVLWNHKLGYIFNVMVKSEDIILGGVWCCFPELKDPYNNLGILTGMSVDIKVVAKNQSVELIILFCLITLGTSWHSLLGILRSKAFLSSMFSFILQEVCRLGTIKCDNRPQQNIYCCNDFCISIHQYTSGLVAS